MLLAMGHLIDYSVPGPLTELRGIDSVVLRVEGGPVSICAPVSALVLQPTDAEAIGLPPGRLAENQLRRACALVARLLEIDPTPLAAGREPERRVIGTCRHFALLACALLRHHRVTSRVRCGFATYFQPGQGLDHWIVEYRDEQAQRWVRVDPEVLGQELLDHPEDLAPAEFLTGGEAWTAHRRGEIDARTFGVYGTENWGPGEIRGNLVKDLAALNKVEMLPWDEWGRMDQGYQGTAGIDYDELLDVAARVCRAEDTQAIVDLYAEPDLRVPAHLIG
jgi:Transglutaminase-like superfamily